MNRLRALLVICGAVVGPCLPLDAFVVASPQSSSDTTATDRYIVQFELGTDPDQEAAALSDLGVDVVEVFNNVFPGATVQASAALIEQVRAEPSVTDVELDQVMSLSSSST